MTSKISSLVCTSVSSVALFVVGWMTLDQIGMADASIIYDALSSNAVKIGVDVSLSILGSITFILAIFAFTSGSFFLASGLFSEKKTENKSEKTEDENKEESLSFKEYCAISLISTPVIFVAMLMISMFSYGEDFNNFNFNQHIGSISQTSMFFLSFLCVSVGMSLGFISSALDAYKGQSTLKL